MGGKPTLLCRIFTIRPFLSHFYYLTVNTQKHLILRKLEILKTDEIDFQINTNNYFCISIYVEKGALRSENLIDNVDLITVRGNAETQRGIHNQRRKRDKVRKIASNFLGMYFHKSISLIQSVRILNNTNASSIYSLRRFNKPARLLD